MNDIIDLKRKYLEYKKKDIPIKIMEMGLETAFIYPIDINEEFSKNRINYILHLNNGDDIDNLNLSNISAVMIDTDETILKGDLDNVSFFKSLHKDMPVIANDFIIDKYQIYLLRAFGVDAIVIRLELINENRLKELVASIREMGMTPIVYIKNNSDIAKLKDSGLDDLNFFIVDVSLNINMRITDINKKNRTLKLENEDLDDLRFFMNRNIIKYINGSPEKERLIKSNCNIFIVNNKGLL